MTGCRLLTVEMRCDEVIDRYGFCSWTVRREDHQRRGRKGTNQARIGTMVPGFREVIAACLLIVEWW